MPQGTDIPVSIFKNTSNLIKTIIQYVETYTTIVETNLIPGNIKAGITIFGVLGTFSGGLPGEISAKIDNPTATYTVV